MTDRRAHNDAQRWTPDGVAAAAKAVEPPKAPTKKKSAKKKGK